MTREHVDVLIVGAGLSGVGAACRLQQRCPGKTFAILEARGAIGGTWDLFRFPGIRSDSDMFTLSYPFRPWTGSRAIVDGASILDYVRETAREHGVDRRIRFHHRVVAAEWSSHDARWTVEIERGDTGETVQLTCGFLFTCTGYYRYDEGYTPAFEGVERFGGEIVHPQFWTDDVDYAGKRVVVIGSGATAVTLIPALAERAAHVTMLQRSPSYILSLPGVRPARRPARPRAAGAARLSARALEERAARAGDLPLQPPPARARCGGSSARRSSAGSRPASTSTRTSPRATSRGTSACASCPTATSSRRSAAAACRSSPTASRRSPRPASRWRPGPSSRPT